MSRPPPRGVVRGRSRAVGGGPGAVGRRRSGCPRSARLRDARGRLCGLPCHPAAISNSYGGSEYSGSLAAAYDQPGIAVTAASGDYGYGVSAPASFRRARDRSLR